MVQDYDYWDISVTKIYKWEIFNRELLQHNSFAKHTILLRRKPAVFGSYKRFHNNYVKILNFKFKLKKYPAYSFSICKSDSNRCNIAPLSSTIIGLISGTGAFTRCIGGGGRGSSYLESLDKILSFPRKIRKQIFQAVACKRKYKKRILKISQFLFSFIKKCKETRTSERKVSTQVYVSSPFSCPAISKAERSLFVMF